MKGKIEVSSQLNKGSDFHVRFPIGKEHYDPHTTLFIEKPHEENTAQPMQSNMDEAIDAMDQRTRILIVEDNPELLAYLTKIFEKEYRVYTATNGKEALAKLHYIQPLIVLSDVMMPEMRGDDLCVSIKSNIDTSHIAVVLISALSDQQSIINGLSVKADAYVTKPFDMKVLQLTLRNLVESRQKLRERLASLEDINENIADGTSELDLKLMKELKEIISANLEKPDFTVDTLAYELRVSRTTLYNKVKGLTGNTPSDLIREARINKAKKLLREHRYQIVEIGELVGFSDQKYFREVFKKTVGMTPSEYAKTN
jgi:YesN/AraC family two-component response regulator